MESGLGIALLGFVELLFQVVLDLLHLVLDGISLLLGLGHENYF